MDKPMGHNWLPVVGWDGLYEVSDLGLIWSIRRRLVLKPGPDNDGYPHVVLSWHSRQFTRKVASLVAEAFLGQRPEGLVVRHLDGDRSNNAAANLAYGTVAENTADQVRHGTHNNASKTCCPQCGGEYSRWRSGRRYCRPCSEPSRRAASARYWAKQKAAQASVAAGRDARSPAQGQDDVGRNADQ